MLYQLYDITKEYMFNNKMIGIAFKTEMKLPIMTLKFETLMKNEIIKKDYPKNYEKDFSKRSFVHRSRENRGLMRKILLENFSKLEYITDLIIYQLIVKYILGKSFKIVQILQNIYQHIKTIVLT